MNRRTEQCRDRLDAHVFVCTNTRDPYFENCQQAGGGAVLEAVRAWLRERDAHWSTVGVHETSCLGLCSRDGAAVTVQPADEWYADVTPEDVPDLLAEAFGEDAESVPGRTPGPR